MCGIAGLVRWGGLDTDDPARLDRMTDALVHRGPDGRDTWVDAEAGVGLGHRRLAIVELTDNGKQPMASADGRWVMTYNGEVYNHMAIRDELAAVGITPAWRGHSDTETMVEAVAHWGVAASVEKFVGMFAIALWDRAERQLYLIRDRVGIKPLFWGIWSGGLAFGSELKALRPVPDIDTALDPAALAAYLRLGYVPAPMSILTGVRKQRPGTILRFAARAVAPVESTYWSMAQVAAHGRADPFAGDFDAAVAELDEVLGDAVALRTMADVPLGAFLSGGIDSSTVVAQLVKRAGGRVRTFSIGFDEDAYDESVHAAAVARHLGTDHTELRVLPTDALKVIPELPRMYDEPFADSSQIPTHLVCKLAREAVTVALSGDGGDELFAGYTRYFVADRTWRWLKRVPVPIRRAAANAVRGIRPDRWDGLLGLVGQPAGMTGDRMHKAAGVLHMTDLQQVYGRFVSQMDDPASLLKDKRPIPGLQLKMADAADVTDPVSAMRFVDTLTYLPDDILTKVDRASMAVALEARVPLLDHRVLEFAWRLPPEMLIRGGMMKAPLRAVLAKDVPPSLTERPKQGFGVPIEHWLRTELRDWAGDLLSHDRLVSQGLLDADAVRRLWAEHVEGQHNHQAGLWVLLMLQSWLDAWTAQ